MARTSGAARKPLVAGNWKMNLSHLEAIALVQKLAFTLKPIHYESVEVAVLPPFTAIRSVQSLIDGDKLLLRYGAQDLSEHVAGAYTGDVSGTMLAKLGCSFVVVGHSERRRYHSETDEIINLKVKAALTHGMTPILCIGEGLEVRASGAHVEHCLAQLTGGLAGVSETDAAALVVAYEPVWAIGTGKVATPQDAQQVCHEIREKAVQLYGAELGNAMRVLYGGSVKAANAADLMKQPDVDGALVGGASLDAEEFAGICIAAAGGPFT
jgi:triosephosphate isomerase (TIM)